MTDPTPRPENVTLTDEERRAEVEALLPFAWDHSARCLSGDHSCWEDEDDPRESYESPWCSERREAAQKAYRHQVDALLALRDRDLAARDQALREEIAGLKATLEQVERAVPVCTFDLYEGTCGDLVGGKFPNGAEFTEVMCCVPCRVRRIARGETR